MGSFKIVLDRFLEPSSFHLTKQDKVFVSSDKKKW